MFSFLPLRLPHVTHHVEGRGGASSAALCPSEVREDGWMGTWERGQSVRAGVDHCRVQGESREVQPGDMWGGRWEGVGCGDGCSDTGKRVRRSLLRASAHGVEKD